MVSSNVYRKSHVSVKPLEVEGEDGKVVKPLNVDFKDSTAIMPCCEGEGQTDPFVIEVKVTFRSDKPLAFSDILTFSDDLGNRCVCLLAFL